ncbi:leucyl/phenylalanyl-tRNA--protein transferase [Sphingomonas sp. 32-62-10]|uniref:leucyl/phenylalanyl-tRNA--protein transferase n=1 Tax=Sphingomonas sp. 32-62-10 TaxID=1970436 RepID=UPI000BD294A0|nr:MAG: leucyl/phenylalanyl-tRNA--protein transferase [Sphingomonas sp. 12-62-6]OYX38909.1 MAG: leucyl/phenylalanyl-tRNA--protein transferase [Sphingomonas sp. 32-62-10]
MTALDPKLVLGAYAVGVFPMADHRGADSIYWVEPKRRAILPLDGFHLSHSLKKTIAADRFRVTADTAFEQVIALCAASAADRPDTWISTDIERAFIDLHRMGYAHSVECWDGERLVGGLYGLALGRAFFGESMVSRARDASKVALAWLVARLKVGGFQLLDCQFQTDHLASLGAIEISRRDYLAGLSSAVDGAVAGALGGADGRSPAPTVGDFSALDRLLALPPDPATASPPLGKVIAQLLVHTS